MPMREEPLLIATLSNGVNIQFVTGDIDDWCVEIKYPKRTRGVRPRDAEYFTELQDISKEEPTIYEDYVKIYDLTTKELSKEVVALCIELASKYNKPDKVARLFITLYGGMIAEINKLINGKPSRLGKRIKRLGMHQVLVEQAHPAIVAKFSTGMSWEGIDAECKARGF
jgi:hypothetical protein